MIGWRIGGLAATTAATLGTGFFLPRDLMQSWLRWSAFYFLFALALVWTLLALRTYGSRTAAGVRRHFPALLLALLLSGLVFWISPPRFKILADETNLLGVSMMMHETRTAAVPLQGINTDFGVPEVTLADVKRPMLFSFLTAQLHSLLGYSAANGFVLNFLVSVAVLWFFYLSITRLLPVAYGIFGTLLLAGAPVYLMCSTSSGFELLNVLLLVMVFVLFVDLETAGVTYRKIEMLLFTLVLLAHCRYESTAVLLVVVPALAATLWRQRFFAGMSWRVALLPVFLLPVIWQRVLHWGQAELNRVGLMDYQRVESPFGWQNLSANVDDNLFVLLGLNPDYGFTPLLSALALAGLYLWIRSALRGEATTAVSVRTGITALGVFALLFLIISSFYWGNFGIPMDIRLSLVFLPFLCWSATYGVFRIRRSFRPRFWRRPTHGMVVLAVFHLLLFWPTGALQRPLQQLSLPYEYDGVLDFIRQRYPDRGYTLLVTDLPNLYLVQGYSALKINDRKRLQAVLKRPNIFDRVLAVQKYDKASGSVLAPYRLPDADFQLRSVGSFALTSKIGIRISELQILQKRKAKIP